VFEPVTVGLTDGLAVWQVGIGEAVALVVGLIAGVGAVVGVGRTDGFRGLGSPSGGPGSTGGGVGRTVGGGAVLTFGTPMPGSPLA
jgi:hypothetical protein